MLHKHTYQTNPRSHFCNKSTEEGWLDGCCKACNSYSDTYEFLWVFFFYHWYQNIQVVLNVDVKSHKNRFYEFLLKIGRCLAKILKDMGF